MAKSSRKKTWEEFREEYELAFLGDKRRHKPQVAKGIEISLRHFERVCRPKLMADIDADTIRTYWKKRLADGISAWTVCRELRELRSALGRAVELDFIAECPTFTYPRRERKQLRFVTPDDFAAIYAACASASVPVFPSEKRTAADWWRALVVMAASGPWYMSDLLAFRWREVEPLERDTAIRYGHEKVPLTPTAIRLLRAMYPHGTKHKPEIFAWPDIDRQPDEPARWRNGQRGGLLTLFHQIQEAAGIPEPYYGLDHLRVSATVQLCAGMIDRLAGRDSRKTS